MQKILSLLFIFSSYAIAGHSGEIYTYGYFQYVEETLIALSGVVANGNDYLFKIVIALSMLIFIIKNIGNPKGSSMLGFEAAKFLTVVTLIQQLFLTAPDDDRHAYAIVDRITNQTAEVRQIPKGIGEMLSLFSRLEDAVMDKMDMFFSTPNSISYRNAGLGFTMTSQMEIFQSTIIDPHLKRSFDVYYENCKMLGDYADGLEDINEVLNSNDLMTLLGTDQSLLTIVYDSANPSGVTTPCFTAWDNIKSRIMNSATNQMNAVTQARGLTAAVYGVKAEEVYQTLYGSFLSAQNQFEEAILRNATLESVQGVASSLGIGAERLAKNKSIAEMSMVTEAGMSNLEAQGIVPLMKAISMMFVIALSWLLAVLAIATMNMSYLKFLITLNVWLMLWSPLYTVLNFAMDVMVNNSMAAYNAGVAINSQMSMYQVLGAKLAVLAKLVWAIPMLAFAVAKGSDQAMTSFIGGMAQGIQTGISTANTQELRQTASGNFSYISGNEQFGGKVNEHGQHVMSRTDGRGAHGQVETSISETNSGVTSATKSKSGSFEISGNTSENGGYALGAASISGAGIGANKVESAQQAETKAKQEVHSIIEGSSLTNSNAVSKMTNATAGKESAEGKAYNEKVNTTEQEKIDKVLTKAQEDASNAQAGKTLTVTTKEGETQRLVVGANGKIGTPEWLGASADLSISKQGDVSYTDEKGQQQTLQTSNSFKESWNEQMAKSVQHTIAGSQELGNSWMTAIKNTYSEQYGNNDTTQDQYNEAYSKANSTSNTYSAMKSLNEQISQDKLPSMMMNYFKNDENLKSTYFNEHGNVKDKESMEALALEGQKLLGKWTQGGEEGLKHFAAFANQYGGINTGGDGIKANVDGALNDKTAVNVENQIFAAKDGINGADKTNVTQIIKTAATSNEMNTQIDAMGEGLTAPNNHQVLNEARDVLNSKNGVDVANNLNEINIGITGIGSNLKGAEPFAGKLEEAYEWAEKQGIAPAGGKGQTPGSSQYNKTPDINENLAPISPLIANFGSDK